MTGLELAGMRAATAALTWGQAIVADSLGRRTADEDYNYNLTAVVPIPSGRTIEQALDALRNLVRRHDSLHTVFSGGIQRVEPAGELVVGIEADADVTPIKERLSADPFDPAKEWGLRAVLIHRYGQPYRFVLGLSHLSVDAWAAGVLTGDLRRLLRHPDRELAPAWQPVDQAHLEQGEAGRIRNERALDHLRALVSDLPAAAPLPAGGPPKFGELRSPAAERAATALAKRCHASDSAAYLAAFSRLLERGPECLLKAVAYNRHSAAEQGCVAPFALDAYVRIPVEGPDGFEGLVRRCWAASMRAYQHARCDPIAAREVVSSAGADPPVLFNDFRAPSRPVPAPGESEFRWLPPIRPPGLRRYFALADGPAGQTLSLLADLPADGVRDFLLELESLLVGAAG